MVLVPAHAARGSLRLQGVRFAQRRPRPLDRAYRVRGPDDTAARAAARKHRNPHAGVFLKVARIAQSAIRERHRCCAIVPGFRSAQSGLQNYRFENWKLLRALALPYFLRSTTRESRVTKPPRLRTERSSGSCLISALDMPWRTAPAWPDSPPPDTVQTTSYCPWRFAATSGC